MQCIVFLESIWGSNFHQFNSEHKHKLKQMLENGRGTRRIWKTVGGENQSMGCSEQGIEEF